MVVLKRNRYKRDRQQAMVSQLQENPFLTDEDLAELLSVSVPTVRLDRLELGIPELRVRTKDVAEQFYGQIRSLGTGELIGDILELDVGKRGISVLEVKKDMVFSKTKILRGHYLFAQCQFSGRGADQRRRGVDRQRRCALFDPCFFKRQGGGLCRGRGPEGQELLSSR